MRYLAYRWPHAQSLSFEPSRMAQPSRSFHLTCGGWLRQAAQMLCISHRVRNLAAPVVAFGLAQAFPACAFEQSFDTPAFIVSVPRLPSIALAAPSASQGGGVLTARGQDTTYVVEIIATASAAAGSPRACAGTLLRELIARPKMPDRDNIYRAPVDPNTFLVLYLMELDGKRLLHAHLLSAAGSTHCIDAHFSRTLPVGEDIDNWRTTFDGATVRTSK